MISTNTMKINLDGSIEMIEGETFPFICPKCKWPIDYDNKVIMVNCFHCGTIGTVEEFSKEGYLNDSKTP